MSARSALTATIANGETVSSAIKLGGAAPVLLITPAALTGTAITFQVSADGSTYVPLHTTAGVAVSLTVAASRAMPLDPATFRGAAYLKVVSGSAEGAARSIVVVAQEVR